MMFLKSYICNLQVLVFCLLVVLLLSRIELRLFLLCFNPRFFSLNCAWLLWSSVACDWSCRLPVVEGRLNFIPLWHCLWAGFLIDIYWLSSLQYRLLRNFSISITSNDTFGFMFDIYYFKIYRMRSCFHMMCQRRSLLVFLFCLSVFILPYFQVSCWVSTIWCGDIIYWLAF